MALQEPKELQSLNEEKREELFQYLLYERVLKDVEQLENLDFIHSGLTKEDKEQIAETFVGNHQWNDDFHYCGKLQNLADRIKGEYETEEEFE